MSRRLGSKNKNKTFFSIDRCNAKTEKLLKELVSYRESTLGNGRFSRHIDFNLIYNMERHLKNIISLELTNLNS